MSNARRLPWLWVPTLYFAESIPNAVVSDTAKVMFTDFGLTPDKLGLVAGSMYLAWVLKPFWSPLVDLVKTKRWWIVLTELLLAGSFLGLALAVRSPNWLLWTQVCLWTMALASATQDIAADGFYMLGLNESEQAGYTGIRATSYRLAMLFAKGALVWTAGRLTQTLGMVNGWSITLMLPGILFVLVAIYHWVMLPRPESDVPHVHLLSQPTTESGPLGSISTGTSTDFWSGYRSSFTTFFAKPRILQALAFMLLFRLAEAQVLAMVAPFLKGKLSDGGLALTNEQFGVTYGTFGVIGLICGGIMAGALVAKYGLRRWYWVLIAVMHLPNLAFIYLAFSQNTNSLVIDACLFTEQFGYGFGFTTYILYLMYFAKGELQTSHYAIATGFMALSLMLPQMVSGFVQKALGFQGFFGYVAVCTLPSFFVAWLAWRDKDFLNYFEPKPKLTDSDGVGISPD